MLCDYFHPCAFCWTAVCNKYSTFYRGGINRQGKCTISLFKIIPIISDQTGELIIIIDSPAGIDAMYKL